MKKKEKRTENGMKGPSRNPELKFIGKVPVFSLESSIFVVLNLTAKGLIVLF